MTDIINSLGELAVVFPQSEGDCRVASEGFRSINAGDSIINCVSIIDGIIIRTITPPKEDAKNVSSYFSGHYQAHGMNIQAAVDQHSRFTYLGVAGPGFMSDRNTIDQISLGKLIEQLLGKYCVIADCAYRPTEHSVPIFGGAQAMLSVHDDWNYYASQCRIRIKMAFGLM